MFLDGAEVRRGRVRDVTAGSLTLWERHGTATIPRARIARVATRVENGTTKSPRVAKAAAGSAIVSAVLGLLIASVGENGTTKGDGVTVFAVGTIAGIALASALPAAPKYEERLVYIRQ